MRYSINSTIWIVTAVIFYFPHVWSRHSYSWWGRVPLIRMYNTACTFLNFKNIEASIYYQCLFTFYSIAKETLILEVLCWLRRLFFHGYASDQVFATGPSTTPWKNHLTSPGLHARSRSDIFGRSQARMEWKDTDLIQSAGPVWYIFWTVVAWKKKSTRPGQYLEWRNSPDQTRTLKKTPDLTELEKNTPRTDRILKKNSRHERILKKKTRSDRIEFWKNSTVRTGPDFEKIDMNGPSSPAPHTWPFAIISK